MTGNRCSRRLIQDSSFRRRGSLRKATCGWLRQFSNKASEVGIRLATYCLKYESKQKENVGIGALIENKTSYSPMHSRVGTASRSAECCWGRISSTWGKTLLFIYWWHFWKGFSWKHLNITRHYTNKTTKFVHDLVNRKLMLVYIMFLSTDSFEILYKPHPDGEKPFKGASPLNSAKTNII